MYKSRKDLDSFTRQLKTILDAIIAAAVEPNFIRQALKQAIDGLITRQPVTSTQMDETRAKDRGSSLPKGCVMPPARIYSTAGAFRTALEARPKKASLIDPTDLNRLRRQVSFDRLLATLFQQE